MALLLLIPLLPANLIHSYSNAPFLNTLFEVSNLYETRPDRDSNFVKATHDKGIYSRSQHQTRDEKKKGKHKDPLDELQPASSSALHLQCNFQ
jgi:hypothetical protein